jgi:hypothetical protein
MFRPFLNFSVASLQPAHELFMRLVFPRLTGSGSALLGLAALRQQKQALAVKSRL